MQTINPFGGEILTMMRDRALNAKMEALSPLKMNELQQALRDAIVRTQPKITTLLSDASKGGSYLSVVKGTNTSEIKLPSSTASVSRIGSFR